MSKPSEEKPRSKPEVEEPATIQVPPKAEEHSRALRVRSGVKAGVIERLDQVLGG